ncbi:FecR family protein [Halarcobacter mediterraneus]|nr:FecR family protein [Halarcobacter mediterraneus]
MENKIKEQAVYWITCEKEGLNESQKKELKSWLKENPFHQKAYDRMKFIHQMSNSLSKENSQKLSSEVHRSLSKSKLSFKVKSYYTSAAAIVLVLFFSLFKIYDENSLKYEKVYSTNTQSILEQSLPDGSIISLDAKTKLDIKFYKNKREAFLSNGKVMFNVEKNENRPFLITSNNIQIEVVGTKFEVISSNNKTTINVKEGKVRTYFLNDLDRKVNTRLLTKAETITYTNQGKINKYLKLNPNKIALWQNNLISFNQISLKEALEEFSKYYDYNFDFSHKKIENYIITGEFATNQIDIFLSTITKIYPLNIDKKDKLIKISKKIEN